MSDHLFLDRPELEPTIYFDPNTLHPDEPIPGSLNTAELSAPGSSSRIDFTSYTPAPDFLAQIPDGELPPIPDINGLFGVGDIPLPTELTDEHQIIPTTSPTRPETSRPPGAIDIIGTRQATDDEIASGVKAVDERTRPVDPSQDFTRSAAYRRKAGAAQEAAKRFHAGEVVYRGGYLVERDAPRVRRSIGKAALWSVATVVASYLPASKRTSAPSTKTQMGVPIHIAPKPGASAQEVRARSDQNMKPGDIINAFNVKPATKMVEATRKLVVKPLSKANEFAGRQVVATPYRIDRVLVATARRLVPIAERAARISESVANRQINRLERRASSASDAADNDYDVLNQIENMLGTDAVNNIVKRATKKEAKATKLHEKAHKKATRA